MRATTLATASALVLAGSLAPTAASALTFTAPLLPGSATSLGNDPANVAFAGGSTFPVPAGYTLSSVTLTVAGTTGGTFKASNPIVGSTNTLTPTQNFGLTANNNNSPGYTNTITPQTSFTIPAATFTPPFGPYVMGTANFNVTSAPQTLTWTIWNTTSIGGTIAPIGDPTFFMAATPQPKQLPVNTFFSLTSNPGGAFIMPGDNASTLALPSNLAGSFVTYNFVPGPLPILGAGAAFSWSRRLRKRISQRV
jgi:hypothetical protein